jgi:hypothetical protein
MLLPEKVMYAGLAQAPQALPLQEARARNVRANLTFLTNKRNKKEIKSQIFFFLS